MPTNIGSSYLKKYSNVSGLYSCTCFKLKLSLVKCAIKLKKLECKVSSIYFIYEENYESATNSNYWPV